MAGRLASQATGAFDAAMNGGPGISMCVLQSAPTANPRIGTSHGGTGSMISRDNRKILVQKRNSQHRKLDLFDDDGEA